MFRHLNNKWWGVMGWLCTAACVAGHGDKTMRLPKGKLLALVALVLAASMVMATGAFTTVTAQRSMNVEVAGDKKAFLGIAPSDGPNSAYAHQKSNGELVINFNSKSNVKGGGTGVNPDAVSSFDKVFTITNQGTQPVKVWITDESDRVSFYVGHDTGKRPVSESSAIKIGVGNSKDIGIIIDATNMEKGEKLLSGDDDMIIHAVAPNAQVPKEAADSAGGSNGNKA